MILRRHHRIRIARSLVTILLLTLVQMVAAPILAPQSYSPQAEAANSAIVQTNLTLDANATVGANDVASVLTFGSVSPVYTNSGVGYYTFDGTTNKYAYAQRDFANDANVSIFMWVYPTAAGVILNHTGQADPTGGYRLTTFDITSAGKFRTGLYNGSAVFVTSSITTPLNNWYYVGLTYDGSTIRQYINGQATGSMSMATWTTSASDFFNIGAPQGGTCFGTCTGVASSAASFRFGELSIYRSMLTSNEVSSNYNQTELRFAPTFTDPTNTTSYASRNVTFTTGTCTSTSGATCTYQWQTSTNGGSTWVDISGATSSTLTVTQVQTSSSGNQYRVEVTDPGVGSPGSSSLSKTSSAATLTVIAQPGGETDTALALNGSNQYAWVADTGTGGVFDLGTTMTMEAWVYPTETSSAMYIVATKVDSFQLFHIDGIWKYAFRPSGTNFGLGLNTLIPVRTNEWHHIAVTRSANVSYFYYDGQLAYTGTGDVAGSSVLNDNAYPFVMGGKSYDGTTFTYPFKGSIDHFALYGLVRDLSGIDSDMDSYISTSSSGLRAYYDFNEGSGSTLINRSTTATPASDLAILGSPSWSDVKIVSNSAAYTTVKFPRTYITVINGWKIPTGVSTVSALIVGGGGGGGWNSGGGGGGGGYLYLSSINLSGIVGVQIGAGGRGGQGPDNSGTPTYIPTDGSPTIFNATSVAGGNKGTVFSQVAGGAGIVTASGTSGAGGTGGATSGTPGANGGAGITQTNFGETLIYSAGGGGGGYSAAGGIGGGVATSGAGNGGGTTRTTGTIGLANRGGGGGASAARVDAGNGGSGVVIVKYLIASSKPIFSGPFNDTTTAGLTETFTVTGTPNDPLVRSYRWQVSTDTGTSWSTPTQGSGWFTASYVTPTLTTAMSGTRYQYRVIVTDTDTAGLTMTETSSAVYLIINPALQMTGNATISKAINVLKVETFTVTGGTPTLRYSLSPTISGITLDTATAGSPSVRISETKTVGTYYETLTVTDSASASVVIPLTISVIAPPTFTASAEQVVSGTILDLDPGSSASYTGTGSSWKDLSGRGADANINYDFGTVASYADGSTRANASYTNLTCAGGVYNSANFGSFEFTSASTTQCIYATNSIPVTAVSPLPVYTVSTWIKRNGAQAAWRSINCNPYRFAGDQIIFCLFWASETSLNAGIFNGGTWYQTTGVIVPDLTWVMATVTYNGGTSLNLYLNDTATAYSSGTISVNWASSKINTGLILGRKWDQAVTFNGSIGQIRIYDRILTTSEIAQNYNATKSRYLTTFNKTSPTKKYGVVATDTYTVFSSASSLTASIALNSRAALKWDTSTARAVTVRGQESLTVGSYLETITVTDGLGQSAYLALTYSVTKADTLTVSMDTGTVVTFNGNPITIYPKPVYKGLVGVDTLTVTTKFSSTLYSLSAIAPTNADTYTVIAADPVFTTGASSNYYNIIYETSTAVVNKAKQAALNPSMYGAVVGSPFTLTLLGGSGDGAVTETLTGVSTAPNCAISSHVLTSSATQIAYCQVRFTKASSQNYLSESITVQIYFMIYVINQPSGQNGAGSTIGINGETSITRSSGAPAITGVSSSGDLTYPIAITGSGFNGSSASETVVKFWRGVAVNSPDFIIKSDTLIWSKQPVGATTGKVLVENSNGTGVSPSNFVP
jgi:hypothetical protein